MLEMVIDPVRKNLGGFEVARILPFARRRAIGPFVFFDHMGPAEFAQGAPRSADVRPHPHIGLSTLTYLFEGEITHRDSTGVQQDIRPGEVNWMVAGSGISHSERFDGPLREPGARIEGIQAWIALPAKDEETAPGFVHVGAGSIQAIRDGGLSASVVAGSVFGASEPFKTFSPLFYVHATLAPGASCPLPSGYTERAAYVVSGAVECEGRSYAKGQMLVFGPQGEPTLTATQHSVVMLLGGEPLGERHIWWNFVSSSKERIEQAKADWKAGRFKLPDGDSDEFIPLPEEPRPPQPMS
ncbi:MAG: pirin family protein [Beijerinckiaceae bacterium]|nr:pirin family protein [Beijerinckiaceae bacterium]